MKRVLVILCLLLNVWFGYNAFGQDVIYSIDRNSATAYINRYSHSSDIVIPSTATIQGKSYAVRRIGKNAFADCSDLTSITIPSSVTCIGEVAFFGCSGLTSIKVEQGNSKYDSRNNCNAIIETATNTLIAGCASTIIPSSVTSIGGGAFYGCGSQNSPCKLIVDSNFDKSVLGKKRFGENGAPDYYYWNGGYFTEPITYEDITIGQSRCLAYHPDRNIDVANAGFSAYTAIYDSENGLSIFPMSSVSAGTPILLVGNPGTYTIYSMLTSAEEVAANDLRVADSAIVADGSQWMATGANNAESEALTTVAASDNTTISFTKIPNGITIPAGQVYLYIPAGTVSGNTLTSIDGATQSPAIESRISEIYDLNGRRIDTLQKGINIIRYQDGSTKKVIIK